ncbi:ParB/RepB/Spo0J family partition protein [Streptomyces sp. NPDC004267]|uniref:ParB/RepB/Spo0J family partition protein n=1 Tax=Streptomyces sp. NPDC004267 TaxID=3364694 RepID=UPI00367BD08B
MAISMPKPARGAGKAPQKADDTPKSELYKRVQQDGDVIEVPVDDIDANPFNDREMVGIDELAESIKVDGLLSPVTLLRRTTFAKAYPNDPEVQSLTKEWVLGPGEHRWRASIKAGERKIRGILRDDLADRIRGILLLENVYRTDPSPMEKARKVHEAMTKDGLSIREAARILKMGNTSVHKLTELVKLPAEVAEAVHRGYLVPTHARKLLALGEPESVSAAYRLMAEHKLSADEAVDRVLAGGPSAANIEPAPAEPTSSSDSSDPSAKPDVPQQTRIEQSEGSLENSEDAADEKADNDSSALVLKPEPETRPAPKSPKATATPDPNAAERDTASAHRDAACWSLLSGDTQITSEQMAGVMARALLQPQKQEAAPRAKAHVWLRKANRHGFDVTNSDAYHQAVLSSRDPELIARVTFAAALAASEIRAADRRRPRWDQHDAAHVQFLMDTTGYVVETDWERQELTRLNVTVPEGQPTEG